MLALAVCSCLVLTLAVFSCLMLEVTVCSCLVLALVLIRIIRVLSVFYINIIDFMLILTIIVSKNIFFNIISIFRYM